MIKTSQPQARAKAESRDLSAGKEERSVAQEPKEVPTSHPLKVPATILGAGTALGEKDSLPGTCCLDIPVKEDLFQSHPAQGRNAKNGLKTPKY